MTNTLRRVLLCGAALLAGGVAGTKTAGAMDVSFIPADAVGAVIVRPRQFLTSPQAKLMPIEVFSALGKQRLGIDPLDIEQAVMVFDKLRNPQAPPEFGVILRLTKPYQQAQILPEIFGGARQVTAGSKSYLKGDAKPLNALHVPDAQTVVLATEPMMQQMLAVTEPAGHLPTLLQRTNVDHHVTAVASLDAMRAEINAMVAQARSSQVPPPFNQFLALPEHLSAVALRMSLADQFRMELILLAPNDPSAEELERLAKLAVAMGREAAENVATQQMQKGDPNDPVQQATAQYVERMVDYYAEMLEPRRSGRAVTIAAQADPGASAVGVAVSLLLPAIRAGRGAAANVQSSNNLKQIGLAIHNYHDTHREFPTDITDDQGKRLLSWRVRLLPYLEQAPLAKQFRLNEPWDSEHNRQLLAQMPAPFRNPAIADPMMTNYLAPRGEGTLWEGKSGRISMFDVTDGTSNTIMLVEANADKAVPWTKPDDLEVNLQNPLAGLGMARPAGFAALFADGSVKMISPTIAPDVLRALFTRSGGEIVPRDF